MITILTALFLLLSNAAGSPASAPELFPLWTSGEDGYHTCRIPAIVATPAGTLLAFCEGRRRSRSDTGDIDLLWKRSTDGGRTWSEQQVLRDDGQNVCGNPCAVVDRSTGAVWLLSTHNLGQDREEEIIAGTSEGTRTVWVSRSDDDGRTWAEPVEITAATKREDWTWYATGPGIGIQLERGPHAGRLVVPCDHIEAETKRYFSHVILSDDHGATWRLGGRTPTDQVNECQVAELADGRLLLNMRNYDRSKRQRAFSFSQDGGETWSAVEHHPELEEPICQASLLGLATPGSPRATRLIFSNPASADHRVNMTVKLSDDGGASWPFGRTLHEGPSAYSCLVALAGDSIGCLFEGGRENPYEHIYLARFDLDWLVGRSAGTAPAPFSERTIERVQELMPGLMLGLNVPGVQVALVDDCRIVWHEEYGVRRAGEADPVLAGSTMEACSMSKPVYAYAALRLVAEGQLDLDRPLVTYLAEPYLLDQPLYEKITARMVLTHTSGFPNWREGGWRGGGPLPVLFEPGTRYEYSGEGFWYLQQVVETITGAPLDEWITARLLDPLEMKNSSYVWKEEFAALAAGGHDHDGALKPNRPLYDRANAAFSLYTTAVDYARFLIEMMRPDRSAAHSLRTGILAEMLTPGSHRDAQSADWGLGWGLRDTRYGRRVFHGGSNGTGFRCYNEFYSQHGQGIVIMTNGMGGAKLWEKLVAELRD